MAHCRPPIGGRVCGALLAINGGLLPHCWLLNGEGGLRGWRRSMLAEKGWTVLVTLCCSSREFVSQHARLEGAGGYWWCIVGLQVGCCRSVLAQKGRGGIGGGLPVFKCGGCCIVLTLEIGGCWWRYARPPRWLCRTVLVPTGGGVVCVLRRPSDRWYRRVFAHRG